MADKNKDDGFRLNPKDFHTKSIVANGLINSVVDAFNTLDLNKDGKRDIAQVVPVLLSCVPLAVQVGSVVDWGKLQGLLINSYVKAEHRDEFRVAFDKLGQALKPLAELAAKKA